MLKINASGYFRCFIGLYPALSLCNHIDIRFSWHNQMKIDNRCFLRAKNHIEASTGHQWGIKVGGSWTFRGIVLKVGRWVKAFLVYQSKTA